MATLMVLSLLLFTTVDRSSFKDNEFYKQTVKQIDSISIPLINSSNDTVAVGWAEKSLIPENPVRLTGNRWQPYEDIYDSVYVKCFIFANKNHKIALLSYDLWIMHPHLASKIKASIAVNHPSIDGVYLTATHTHSSIGGWATGLLGQLVVGGNNDETVNFIVDQTEAAIREANTSLTKSTMGYGEFETGKMVYNRLNRESGLTDAKIRLLKIRQKTGEQAFLTTYAAHAVYMDKHLNVISSDYPGAFTKQLESQDSVNFAAYASGAVGSHSPTRTGPFDYENLLNYGTKLAQIVKSEEDGIALESNFSLRFAEIPVSLRSPHLRISNDIRVRPWLFHLALGQYPSYISILQLGKTVFIGLPVELSGEFYPELDRHFKSLGLNLIITSFNGNYLGYVNPIAYYDSIKKSETREMNWYGPENGEYFVSLLKMIGNKLKEEN